MTGPESHATVSGDAETIKTADFLEKTGNSTTECKDVTEETVSMETDVDSLSRVSCSASQSEEDSTPMDIDSSAVTSVGASPEHAQADDIDIKAEGSQESVSLVKSVAIETDSKLLSQPITVQESGAETSGSVSECLEGDQTKTREEEGSDIEKLKESIGTDEKLSEQDTKQEKPENGKNEVDSQPAKDLSSLKEGQTCEISNAEPPETSEKADRSQAEEHEKMETDQSLDKTVEKVKSPVDAKPSIAETQQLAVPPKMDQAPLTTEQIKQQKELLDRCIRALEYCLRRFSQHHKSRYRLTCIYFYSEAHKVQCYV